jgi:hypothetical protein
METLNMFNFKFKKRKNKNIYQNITTPEELPGFIPYDGINAIRYTYDAWVKLFPDSNREEWESCTYPTSLLTFVMSTAKESSCDDLPINIITIDDEYIAWLGKLKHNNDALSEYTKELTNNDLIKLAKKHNLHYTYSVCIYPLVIELPEITKKRYRMLTEETRLEFENYLKQIAPTLDIHVSSHLLNMSTADNEEAEKRLVEMAKDYFKSRNNKTYHKWEKVKIDNQQQVPVYGIPIVFRETHDKTVTIIPKEMFNERNVLSRSLNTVEMTDEFFKKFGVKDVQPFLETQLLQNIKKDLGLSAKDETFADYFVGTWNINEYCNEVLKAIYSSTLFNNADSNKRET